MTRRTRDDTGEQVMTLEKTGTVTIGGDLPVRRLGFGAMRLTGPPAWLDRSTALGIVRRAVELGVRFVDTADSYDFGDNEQLLADALYPYPEGVVIATKGGQINLGRDWIPLGRPEYLRQQAELSLRRLRLERIDLYQLHRVDPTVPFADQIGALRRLQDEGKVRHIGLSEVTVSQLTEAEKITPVASVQNRYNLTDRASEDVLGYCDQHGIAFIPWFPVAPVTASAAVPLTAKPGVGGMVTAIAGRLNATPAQIALAWLLHRSPVVLPIPGTSSRAHLEENIAAAHLGLDPAVLAQLTAAGNSTQISRRLHRKAHWFTQDAPPARGQFPASPRFQRYDPRECIPAAPVACLAALAIQRAEWQVRIVCSRMS
jgi:pyridoxine 4-dehydrogenase